MAFPFSFREIYMCFNERKGNYLDWKRPSRNKYQMRSRFKPCDPILFYFCFYQITYKGAEEK